MVTTVEVCKRHVRHVLGSDMPPEMSLVELVNTAGKWLLSAHKWRWLQGGIASLDFTSGQNYVTLPTDFASIIHVNTSSLTSGMTLTSQAGILDLRKNTAASTHFFEAALEWDHSVTPPIPRLAIWPANGATSTGAVSLAYRRKWTEVTSDSDKIHIAEYLEPLFIEAVRAYAQLWDDENPVPLREVRTGVQWAAAVQEDAKQQGHFGRLKNGMAQTHDTGGWWRLGTVPAPHQ